MSASSEGPLLSQAVQSNIRKARLHSSPALRAAIPFVWSLAFLLYTVTIVLSIRHSIPPCQCALTIDGHVKAAQIVYREENSCDPVRWAMWGGDAELPEIRMLEKTERQQRRKNEQEASARNRTENKVEKGKMDKDRQTKPKEFVLPLHDIHTMENPDEARVAKKHTFFADPPEGTATNSSSLPADRTAYTKFFAGFGKVGHSKEYREEDLRNGTFVEVGALDGKQDSMSLFFEKTLGWSGILVEGATPNVRLLRKTKRANSTMKIEKEACRRPRKVQMVGDGPTAMRDEFVTDKNRKQLEKGWKAEWRKPYFVECRQLSEMLQEANTTKVDLMVVRGGVEYTADVLRGLSLEKVEVRVLGVRLPVPKFVGKGAGEVESQVRKYLLGNEFCLAVKVGELEFWTGDSTFKKQYCGWSAFYAHP